jgi:hypothetical protein
VFNKIRHFICNVQSLFLSQKVSTRRTKPLSSSSESWCLVCCKCKKDYWICVFNETINCERFVYIILGQFFPEITEEERLSGWFRQDSVLPTLHVCLCKALSDVFRDSIISSSIWPARPSGLNPCDFFFWGCLKNKLYNSNRQTKDIKDYISREIENIPALRQTTDPTSRQRGRHILTTP